METYCQSDEIRLTDIHREQTERLEKRLSALESRRDAAKNRLVSMYKDKLDGVISEEDFRLFRESLQAEEQELSMQTEALRQQLEDCRKRQENAENRSALLAQYTHFEHLDRSIADEFIDTVEIGEVTENGEREICIHWKI